MGYGKMNHRINITTTEPEKDSEGFVTKGERVLASVRAYMEVRNSTTKWEQIIGNAAFSSVTALFRFRKIPRLTVTTSHFITDGKSRYNIISAEDVRGRGMYIEVLAEKIEGTVM